jgi:hypothetical protein
LPFQSAGFCSVLIFRRDDGTVSTDGPDAPLVDANGQQLRDADGSAVTRKSSRSKIARPASGGTERF